MSPGPGLTPRGPDPPGPPYGTVDDDVPPGTGTGQAQVQFQMSQDDESRFDDGEIQAIGAQASDGRVRATAPATGEGDGAPMR